MSTRAVTLGLVSILALSPFAGAADDDRPSDEPGGLFSLFMGGRSATPTPDADETSAAEEEAPEPEVASPSETTEPAEAAPAKETPPAAEPAPETAAEEAAPAPPEEPPVAAVPPLESAPAEERAASAAVPAAGAQTDELAWPSGPDSGGTLAEQPTPGPAPTPAAGVAAIEPSAGEPAESAEPKARETEQHDEPRDAETRPHVAARQIPRAGGHESAGNVALPETEIQGELEKPDIFFLLPKARDRSDDQVIRARIRREITQPLVKDWLEEMMLLK